MVVAQAQLLRPHVSPLIDALTRSHALHDFFAALHQESLEVGASFAFVNVSD